MVYNSFVQTPHAVQWMRPEAQEGCQVSDWFNILVLHQNRLSVFFWRASIVKNGCFILNSCWTLQPLNTYMVYIIILLVFIICEYWSSPNVVFRVKTNPKNAINEHFLPRFLDFIVWGHEHECLVDPQVLQSAEWITFSP